MKEIFSVFFKLGCIAFGGPAAHVAMMEEEIVTKRKWMDRQHFLDLMGATNLIPGPNSTEMTMHCGYERGGRLGLFLAGFAFIFPAVVITGVLAWFYVEYGELPEVAAFVFGIKPAVLAIILGAILKLGKKAYKNWQLGVLGAIVLLVCLLGVSEIIALLGAGLLGMFVFYGLEKLSNSAKSVSPLAFLVPLQLGRISADTVKIFLSFLKVGVILYGSGYVLFAYLDAELVSTGLMSREALIDAIAIGQFTPGPVLSTATFIGYQLGGFWGAIAATIGIFLPSFLFVLLLNPLIPRMRSSLLLSKFLDCVNMAAVAIMVNVLFDMSRDVLIDWRSIVIAILAMIFTFGPKKLNAMWIIAGAAVLGYLLIQF
ncbi:MAG TPA: chromate efflux transporter [Roseivirga sp.]